MNRMSTSDSDYSIDWLASDEDDCDSPARLTPHGKNTHTPPSSTTSSGESPKAYNSGFTDRNGDSEPKARDHDHGLTRENRSSHDLSCGSPSTQENPWIVPPTQGHTVVRRQRPSGALWTTSEGVVTGKLHHAMKREHNSDLERPTPEHTDKELFFGKCMELQCYIQPLSSILRGLRSGRYSERLSSFQESVAMDRIQRIMGVLQNPHMGERYVSIILKMEEMLRSWFPHVRPNRDHQPVDWRGDSTPAKKQKQHHSTANPPPLRLTSPCSPEDQPPRAADGPLPDPQPTTHLKWLHTSPICSLKTSEWTLGRTTLSPPPPPRRNNLEVTQDNAVSSSTDLQTDSRRQPRLNPYSRPRQGHPPFKISSPCLERLLQAKESIIAPRTVGNGSTSERSWL